MKIKSTIVLAFILSLSFFHATAQRCERKTFCDKEAYGEYDYRSQSSYAILSPGDTARASIVIYSNQDARILVCADPVLGNVNYKIFDPVRKTVKKIKAIHRDTLETPIYKLDEYGEPVPKLDEYGDPIYDEYYDPVYEVERYEVSVSVDTVWQLNKIDKEVPIFDLQKDGSAKPYWEQRNVPKTRRLIIEVTVPKGDRNTEGCVNLKVGHKTPRKQKGFRKM